MDDANHTPPPQDTATDDTRRLAAWLRLSGAREDSDASEGLIIVGGMVRSLTHPRSDPVSGR